MSKMLMGSPTGRLESHKLGVFRASSASRRLDSCWDRVVGPCGGISRFRATPGYSSLSPRHASTTDGGVRSTIHRHLIGSNFFCLGFVPLAPSYQRQQFSLIHTANFFARYARYALSANTLVNRGIVPSVHSNTTTAPCRSIGEAASTARPQTRPSVSTSGCR